MVPSPKGERAFLLDPRGLAVLELYWNSERPRPKVGSSALQGVPQRTSPEIGYEKPLHLEELETGKVLSRKQIDRYGHACCRKFTGHGHSDEELPVYPRKRGQICHPLYAKGSKH